MTKTQYANLNGHIAMYKTNGGGRDLYIHLDNGGYTSLHKPV